MPPDSIRSLRHAALAVTALGALSISVPASLWWSQRAVFQPLRVAQPIQAIGYDTPPSPAPLGSGARAGESELSQRAGVTRHRRSTDQFGGRADRENQSRA
jgi:hypothetical protein